MVDWDWEMPALFVWFFGAAGAILAAPADGAPSAPRAAAADAPGRGPRVLLLAVTPLTVALSQSRLTAASDALRRGDCATATDAALDSLDALPLAGGGVRGPRLVRRRAPASTARGGRDARRPAARPGQLAVRLRARRRPRRWRARTRGRPRQRALRLNPLEPHDARAGAATAARDQPERRRAQAARLADPLG